MSEKRRLKKAFEIYNAQLDLIQKLKILNGRLRDYDLDTLLKENFPIIDKIYFDYQGDAFWFDIPVGERMGLGELAEIEKLTGFFFEEKPYDNRYSFSRCEEPINTDIEDRKINKLIWGDEK